MTDLWVGPLFWEKESFDHHHRHPETKKVRHFMRGVKEQLFAGILRYPPTTVAQFIKEATTIERALQQRCRQYDRPHNASIGVSAVTANSECSLRELIREFIREELRNHLTPQEPVASVAEVASIFFA